LQSTHAALIAAQAKLAEARAHGANTKAIDDEVKALLRQEAALEASAQRTKKLSDLTLELTNTFQTAVQAEAASFETAMDGMLSKNESFGKAMEEAQLKLIASLAKHWAQFFAEKAIADIFFHPALGIAEFAAAAGLFAIAGALSGAAGSLSSTSSTKSTSASSSAATTAASTAQTTPPQTINVAHLDSGGFITQPTLAVVHGQEAVVPLQNQSAMTAIGKAIAAHIAGLPGQSHEISIQLHSDIPALASVLNHNVRTGRVRLMASDSIRVTRRS
jgi:hypothetical protein